MCVELSCDRFITLLNVQVMRVVSSSLVFYKLHFHHTTNHVCTKVKKHKTTMMHKIIMYFLWAYMLTQLNQVYVYKCNGVVQFVHKTAGY